MRSFLYALTFALTASLLLPAAARGRGALGGGGGYEPASEPTKEEIEAGKGAEQASRYVIGCIAAVVALLVVVQFVREVRGNAPPVRVITYSARTDHSYDGTGSHDGAGGSDGADPDSGDDYDSPDETDF
jgi:hypothetical protein